MKTNSETPCNGQMMMMMMQRSNAVSTKWRQQKAYSVTTYLADKALHTPALTLGKIPLAIDRGLFQE